MSMPEIDRLQFRKTERSIEYSPDGVQWLPFHEGEPEAVSRSWEAIRLGYCNDEIITLIHNYNKTQKEKN